MEREGASDAHELEKRGEGACTGGCCGGEVADGRATGRRGTRARGSGRRSLGGGRRPSDAWNG
jgi:hypothetical protein